ncbi:MAG: GldG family protein [Anderseniella sp.]|jgi:ABC-type uncharacterized transport system involved in gliding motility auxiliary subunit|nr:GldG family protein [Anderseniella sp.]
MARRSTGSTLAALALLLGFIALLGVSLWAGQGLSRYRADLTQGQIYTLSDATRAVLEGIDEPVTVRLFHTPQLAQEVPTYARHFDRVQSMLRHYEDLSGGKLRVSLVKVERFSDEEDEAAALGLQAAPLPGGDGSAYFGVAGTNSTDDVETLPFLALERAEFLELDLTRLLFKLNNAGKKKVAILSRLPVAGSVNPQTGQQFPAWAVFDQLREFFEVDLLGPAFDAVPEDADLLLLIAPGELNPRTAYAIDQYALSGKPVIVFADPYSEGQPRAREGLKDNAAFAGLLKSWGLEVDADKVVGDIDNSRQVQFLNEGQPVVVNYVTWLALGPQSFERTDAIFNQVQSLMLASAGALTPVDGSGLNVQPLIASSQRSAMIETKELGNPNPIKLLQSYLPEGGQRMLAARVSGQAKSSFADGKPAETEFTGEHRPQGAINVLAVGDADMLYDTFWAEVSQGPGGRQEVIPRAGNANLLINAVQDMAGGEALSGLRGRGVEQRPFTLVNQLRADANARFRQQEQLLNNKLEETQNKLTSLLSRAKDGEVTLTEDDQKAIEDFRTEMFATRKSLREVQRNLRADIDALGARVKALNIGLVPLLVGFAGFVLLWNRRRRASAAKVKGAGQ